MKWAKKLIYGEEAGKKRTGYVMKLKMGKGIFGLSAIVVNPDSPNQMEIVDSKQLMWKKYPKDDLILIGLAKGEEEACEVVEKLANRSFEATGSYDLKAYVLEHMI